MSDIGDDWKALKEERREKKERNWDQSLELLRNAGANFVICNHATKHVLITAADGLLIDFWPTTGTWRQRGINRNGPRGVRRLLAHLTPS